MVLALMGGLLGAVALGALAGARRTATAYGRYLASIHASDVFVNVPGKLPGMPVMRPITLISSLPGVVSHAAYVGLNGPGADAGQDPESRCLARRARGTNATACLRRRHTFTPVRRDR